MVLRGERLYIKKLELEDVHDFKNWGSHENILLEDYNFVAQSDLEVASWYRFKTWSIFSKYYCIKDYNHRSLGYLAIKNINIFLKTAVLGLVLDPNVMGKRYGSESLELFLNYYFKDMKMNKMILEVACYNKWAKRLYENMGFKHQGEYLYEYPNEEPNPYNANYLEYKSEFKSFRNKLYVTAYRMELTREDFLTKE